MKRNQARHLKNMLPKSPTGITGLDELTGGGLPTGRPTLICGGPGCGKTLTAMEFIVRGATQYNENGVFMSFEENAEELAQNVSSLGFDLRQLVAQKKIGMDYVRIERGELEETGAYDLEGLFIRLGHAIDSIGAKRVVLDTIEALFAGLPNGAIVRAELRRLFRWLKEKGVTVIITGERGEGMLTRNGMEEYVSDCVILLDHRVMEQGTTRRLRVVKYRGSTHGTNEYPFLIDKDGVYVWPVTLMQSQHETSAERVSSGIEQLDFMLGGKGYYRGSTVLISGVAGTGKTSVAASFAHATCGRGERCLYFAFEESPAQIFRNMRSIGLDLERWVKQGQLQFHAVRPTYYGLEMHLAQTIKAATEFAPQAVIFDPISSLQSTGNPYHFKSMLVQLLDFLKMKGITALLTNLTTGGVAPDQTDANVSSLVDTWLLLRDLETNGERNRGLHVLKSRGMAHSNQIREFLLTNNGVNLTDVYVGPGGVLVGSARLAQEAREKAGRLARQQDLERQQLALGRKEQLVKSQIATLQADLIAEQAENSRLLTQEQQLDKNEVVDRQAMARSRQADVSRVTQHVGRKRHNGEDK
jgi:circadian clock protein KaiC